MATVKKACNTCIDLLNEQYEDLDPEFLEFIRTTVENVFKPLMKKAGKEKKPRGVTAFNVFVSDYSAAHKNDDPVMVDGKPLTLFKLASIDWKKATDAVKADYGKKAAEQNAEKGIVPASEKPKKAINAYNIFIREFKEKNKKLKGGAELFQEASKKWKSMTEKQQAAYKKKATAENEANGLVKTVAA